ncbi:MAG: response regulator [Alphaproteobacteria bacterium]|nr:response regulator [Alphaproteobacteria bacterium]
MNELDGISRPKVLLVEDDAILAQAYLEYLGKEPCDAAHRATVSSAIEAIAVLHPEVVLLDLLLPDSSGLDVLQYIHDQTLPISVIVMTSEGSIDNAVEAMRAGAFDFLVKPVSAARFAATFKNALERQSLRRKVDAYEGAFTQTGCCGFIGASLVMQSVYRVIASVSVSNATVFITGESGTGKEICAAAVHSQSPRRDGPLVVVNCAAIPKELMESEIFGHVRGAFTGATSNRKGAAAQADGGTLFFDEIAEMDLGLQAKLLRFVQTGVYQRVGDDRAEKANVRLVCATNRDPLKEVESGRFREDLYYRLHVVPIELPPLRTRDNDVIAIASHMLTKFAQEESKRFTSFSTEVEALFRAYAWPGNVRQLQNTIRNIVVLYDSAVVTREMLPATLRDLPVDGTVAISDNAPMRPIAPLWLTEKRAIEEAIRHCNGNIPKAADLLAISNSTIYRKRRDWAAREEEFWTSVPPAYGDGSAGGMSNK